MRYKLYKKLIIFDMDGTLVDSERDTFLCFNHILNESMNFKITYKEFKELAGLSLEKMFEKVLPNEAKNLSTKLTKRCRQYSINEKHCIDTSVLYEGVEEIILSLKKQKFILVIVSNKPKRAVDYTIEHFKINQFDLIIGISESTFDSKPNPEVINYVLEKYNLKKDDAVIIGDSQIDIQTGKNAGIDTIALTYGYDTKENLKKQNPTIIIDNFKDLKNILVNKDFK